MTTVRSLAEELSLSTATVSRALRGMDGVNERTRARVCIAAKQAGYGNPKASKSVQAKTIALVIVSRTGTDMFELAKRYILVIDKELGRRGWRMRPIFLPIEDGSGLEFDVLESVHKNQNEHFDGCMVIGRLPGQSTKRIHQLLKEQFNGKVVMIARHDVHRGLSGVAQMNYDAGRQAAQVLLDAGHRKIGWLASQGSRDSAAERLGGVLTCLRERDVSLVCEFQLNERQILTASIVADFFESSLSNSREDWPTAWICSNDWLAAKLIVWARSQGLKIAQDVSVVAFDDTLQAEELADTVISSMVFPYELLASKAVELLEAMIGCDNPDAIVWSLPAHYRQGKTIGMLESAAHDESKSD